VRGDTQRLALGLRLKGTRSNISVLGFRVYPETAARAKARCRSAEAQAEAAGGLRDPAGDHPIGYRLAAQRD
jgi:hypothetical protein